MSYRVEASIGVIIPAYNAEKYIQDCLDSVKNQVIPFDEIIIVDDGSTDSTSSICREFQDNNNHVIIITQKNSGLGAARNVGAASSTSDYFIFLDSDDCLSENTTIKLHKEIEEHDVEIIYYDGDVFGDEKYIRTYDSYRRNISESHIVRTGKIFFNESLKNGFIESSCLAAYKADFIRRNGIKFPVNIYYEDTVFTINTMLSANRVIDSQSSLYKRRYRAGSITTSPYTTKHFSDHVKIFKMVIDIMRGNDFIFETASLDYLYNYCSMLFDNYKNGVTKDPHMRDNYQEIFEDGIEYYSSLFKDKTIFQEMSSNRKIRLCYLFAKIDRENLDWQHKEHFYSLIKEWATIYYKPVFKDMNLDDAHRDVGIYGIGKHTDMLIEIYSLLFGKPLSKIIFIDGQISGEFHGNKVYKFKDVVSQLDEVLISSRKYHKEIFEDIRSISDNIPIIDIYNDDNTVYFC